MFRFREYISRGAFFNDASGVHDGDAFRDLGNDTEVVGDEEQPQFQFAAKAIQQATYVTLRARKNGRLSHASLNASSLSADGGLSNHG